jgi:hypothetical protein
MNEIALQQRATLNPAHSQRETRRRKRSSAFYGYWSLVLAVGVGWVLRDFEWINPEHGVGYWFGIVGSVIMLVLLMYPLRKKIPILRYAGAVKHWFRLHMILGLVGPLLILYHCNFRLGSFNSQVALYSMLIVTISGVFGRHFYARIHHGLYGKKANLAELRSELAASLEKNHGLAAIMPNLLKAMEKVSTELQGDAVTQSLNVSDSLRWAFKKHIVRFSLNRQARRELTVRAAASLAVAQAYPRLRRTSKNYIRKHVALLSKVAQFSFYERLFSIWHVFHFPLFFMLILSALVHVLAVHVY